MSVQQNVTPQPIQIHPIAELHETLFQLGILRNRNLILATENYALKDRVKELEGQVEALTAPVQIGEEV